LFSVDYVQQKQAQSKLLELSPQDLIATLTRFSAEGIANSIRRSFTHTKPVVYMSGGGMHNPIIVKGLQELLPGFSFWDTAALGVLPDAKEAVLFAVLANEAVAGGRTNFGNLPNVTLGKVSFPS
jgi:anhydro-N-acetylmuramic acid kinase